MDRLSLTAASGMQEFNLPRFQLNNEIANISTPGFKRSFSNISQTLKVSGPGFDSRFAPTNVYKDQVSLAPGAVIYTGNSTDVALNDSTVLGVSASDGSLAFTRRNRGKFGTRDSFRSLSNVRSSRRLKPGLRTFFRCACVRG